MSRVGGSAGASLSGGQYSLVRWFLGLYLAVHFVALLPWSRELFSDAGMAGSEWKSPFSKLVPGLLGLDDGPAFVTGVTVAAALASLLLAVGWGDRVAALLLAWIWASLFCRNPLISNPGLPYVGWVLLAHAIIPGKPFGSLAARGRVDPDGGWRMPPALFAGAWLLLALGYCYSGVDKLCHSRSWQDGSALQRVLENPLARPTFLREALLALPAPLLKFMTWGALAAEIGFAPLACFRRTRPFAWTLLLAMHVVLMVLVDFIDLTLGMVVIHLFTFDPAWLPPRRAATSDGGPEVELVFYDGTCGLCHRFVRFLLAEDRLGLFRFSPLQGETIRGLVPDAERVRLPDSVVLRTAEGRLLEKSAAAVRLLDRLGGAWRLLSWLLRAIPRPLRDLGYDLVAGVRHDLFPRPSVACPLLPPRLKERFDP